MSTLLPDAEDGLVLGSVALTLAGVALGALLGEPSLYGITAGVVLLFLIAGWRATGSRRLGWLLLFGLVVGVLELWADWLHVRYFGSLVYTHDFGYRLLASPAYVPVGWWVTAVQAGYLALRLGTRSSPWLAVAIVTAAGLLVPPWYEELAASGRAWYHARTGPMISNTPLWLVLMYGGALFSIAAMALAYYQSRARGRALVAGAFAAAGIMFWGVFWFTVLG